MKKDEFALKTYPKRWGDRKDGWRIRNVDPLFLAIPYFMRTRLDSQNLFEETVEINKIEEFIKTHKDEIPGLSIMHIVIATLVRLISQRPMLNRFVIWNKLYARDHISLSLAIKRSMSIEGEETIIKAHFKPTDTLKDVVDRINLELEENQKEGQENSADTISKMMGYFPPMILRAFVRVLRALDGVGMLPPFLLDVSPWHSTMFLTNLGSIGIEGIYHHLYEFGSSSIFVSMGKKTRKHIFDNDGNSYVSKTMNFKVVSDERICDGFYYASSLKLFTKIISNPELLLTAPEKVIEDPGIRKNQMTSGSV